MSHVWVVTKISFHFNVNVNIININILMSYYLTTYPLVSQTNMTMEHLHFLIGKSTINGHVGIPSHPHVLYPLKTKIKLNN